MMAQWTADAIAQRTTLEVKNLRENALRQSHHALVALCDAELLKRKPPRVVRAGEGRHSSRDIVRGFHFVCPNERGVTRNADGTVWTGTWVVKKKHADRAVKIGAYVALHTSRAEPSYLQGVVKDWRTKEREREYADGRPAKTPSGVDFLIEIKIEPKEWQGDATGEKGYFYGDGNSEAQIK